MFTGIVECLGEILTVTRDRDNMEWWVRSPISASLKVDQSVAHNGVCLTVTAVEEDRHAVTLVAETLERSHFSKVQAGQIINLERAMTLQQRLDGHLVQGHVDGLLTCIERAERQGSWHFAFSFEPDQAPLLIDKGSVCINGVSLTVVQPTDRQFAVAIIPYTFEHTTFSQLQPGDRCNVEFDLIAKYLLRWRQLEQPASPPMA